MNITDTSFHTGLHSPMRAFDPGTTEYASRLAQQITDEHSNGLGLDDYEGDSLYVELGDDTIRELAAAAITARGGVQ
jgi:uncharacterized protein YozE (UPF0346 family)